MKRCKICALPYPLVDGVCDSCYTKFKDEAPKAKATLVRLAGLERDVVARFSDNERKLCFSQAEEAYRTLRRYKDLDLSFFRTDVEKLNNDALMNFGLDPLPPNKKDNEINNRKNLFKLLVIVFAALCITSAITNRETRSPYANIEKNAYGIAERAVKDRLKAPSSAKFDRSSASLFVHTNEEDTYTVKGKYEAQNSFGVMLAGEYSVKFRYDGVNLSKVVIVRVDLD